MRGPEPKGIQEPTLRPSSLNHLPNSVTVDCSTPVTVTVIAVTVIDTVMTQLLLLSVSAADTCKCCLHSWATCTAPNNAVCLFCEILFCSTLDKGMRVKERACWG